MAAPNAGFTSLRAFKKSSIVTLILSSSSRFERSAKSTCLTSQHEVQKLQVHNTRSDKTLKIYRMHFPTERTIEDVNNVPGLQHLEYFGGGNMLYGREVIAATNSRTK